MTFTYAINDIDTVASALLDQATSKSFLFYGDMGVGKTTLIKALTKALGYLQNVNSPTFSIVNEYEIADDLIYHFDLFRINSEQEALNFGIDDYLFSDAWIFIEWPEKLGSLLPNDANSIEIVLNKDGSRTLNMTQNPKLTLT